MKAKNPQVKFDLATLTEGDNTRTLFVREGQAPEIKPPAQLGYAGRLDTPRLFMDNKRTNYDPLQCTFAVNAETLSVTLYATEKDRNSADTIKGGLVLSDVVKQFTLNAGTRWTVPNLIELVKRMRPYFATQEAQLALLKNLRNWNVSVAKIYQDVKDENQNGNAKTSLETKVEGVNLPSFVLFAPVFKGYPSENIEVEFGVDASGSGVTLYLDSPTLLDRQLAYSKELMEKEAQWFAEDFGCAVIYQS
jgi:hypothetical protein